MAHKLIQLFSSNLSPEVLLHQILEDKDDIKSVVVITEWKDTTRSVGWSDMRMSETCMSLKVLDTAVSRELNNKEG